MNDLDSIQMPDVTAEPFNDLRVSKVLNSTGPKRKSRAEGSYGADVEEDTIEPQKTRKKVDHSTCNSSSVLKDYHRSNPVTSPHGETPSSDLANNFYDNSALTQAEISEIESTEANLEQADYAPAISDEAGDDAKSAIRRNETYEDEARATPSIIQRKLLENVAVSKSFLPNKVVVRIF